MRTGSTSSPGREMSSSAAPRISWETMTPELPRAPSSAARATESTIWSRPISSSVALLGQPVELVEHGAQGERHVVARVAVGDREDVEVVDLLAPGLEGRERSLDDGAEADEAGIGHGGRRPPDGRSRGHGVGHQAFVTLPAFRQRVHTYARNGPPPSVMRTFCRFASNRRLVATMECERLWPKAGRLPQE